MARVKVSGDGGACHTGRRSCFYRRVVGKADGAAALEFRDAERGFDPAKVYRKRDGT